MLIKIDNLSNVTKLLIKEERKMEKKGEIAQQIRDRLRNLERMKQKTERLRKKG